MFEAAGSFYGFGSFIHKNNKITFATNAILKEIKELFEYLIDHEQYLVRFYRIQFKKTLITDYQIKKEPKLACIRKVHSNLQKIYTESNNMEYSGGFYSNSDFVLLYYNNTVIMGINMQSK